MLNVEHPHFWRHLGAAIVGAVFIGLPIYMPPLAPLLPYLAPVGMALLGAAGTRLIGTTSPPALLPSKRLTPPAGQAPPAA